MRTRFYRIVVLALFTVPAFVTSSASIETLKMPDQRERLVNHIRILREKLACFFKRFNQSVYFGARVV